MSITKKGQDVGEKEYFTFYTGMEYILNIKMTEILKIFRI